MAEGTQFVLESSMAELEEPLTPQEAKRKQPRHNRGPPS